MFVHSINLFHFLFLLFLLFLLNLQLEPTATKIFQKYIEEHNETHENNVIDDIQKALKCCGANNKNEWDKTIPESCMDPATHTVFEESCIPKVKRLIVEYYGTLGTFAVAFGTLQFFAVMLACHFAQTVSKQYNNVQLDLGINVLT